MSGPAAPSARPAGARASTRPLPFYFGPGQGLFGVYHPPEKTPRRSTAIVLCYPAGHEYLRLQRSFRNLATSLARAGFPVLRFDYGGTGDSAGDGIDSTLDRWRQDLGVALDEVKRRSGASRCGLTGVRLGAALAWREALGRHDVDVLVLWDPVLQGPRHLLQLRSLERAWLSDPARLGSPDAEAAAGYLLGFRLGAAMERDLLALDLSTGPFPARARVFAIVASDDPEEATWRERMRATYGEKSCGVLPSVNWQDPASIHTAVYPQVTLRIITMVFEHTAA